MGGDADLCVLGPLDFFLIFDVLLKKGKCPFFLLPKNELQGTAFLISRKVGRIEGRSLATEAKLLIAVVPPANTGPFNSALLFGHRPLIY